MESVTNIKRETGVGGNLVGPVFRSGELAHAGIEAVEIDNPDKEVIVDDHVAYIRVHCDGECIITRETMQKVLGRPFRMHELETCLASFAGQIDVTEDRMRFYFAKKM